MPWVETNDIETYYDEFGSGRPLIVLHGSTDDHRGWAEQLQPLSDEFHVFVYDLRGHGKTGGSKLDRYTIDTYADDLRAFIAAIELDQRPIVFGHSLGGIIGYNFAANHPDKLAGLITVASPTPYTFSRTEWVMRRVVHPAVTPFITNQYVMNGLKWVGAKIAGEDAPTDDEELQQLRESYDPDMPEMDEAETRKVAQTGVDYFTSPNAWELPQTTVLVLYGEHEPAFKDHAEYLEETLNECRAVEIPEAAHNPQVDNPEFIRSQIRGFIDTREVAEPEDVRA